MKLTEFTGSAPVIAMIGMCKNAGKTTALNRLICEYGASGRRIAVTSVGRDGESVDVVTGTAKPPIYIYEGMLAATAAGLLPLSDVSREILDGTDTATPLGRVVVFIARSDGFIQLAGPSVISDMSGLRERLHGFGAETVLIDGALSRRSPVAGALDGVCILSTGASLGRDMDAVVSETAFVCRILTLPEDEPGDDHGEERRDDPGDGHGKQYKARYTAHRGGETECAEEIDELGAILKSFGPERVVFSGAFTDTAARALLQSGAKLDGLRIIVEDSSRILIKMAAYEKLLSRGAGFQVKHGTKLAAVTINPVSAGGWSFDAVGFLEKMGDAVSVPVIDVERL
jgi:hypothetical protein